MSPCVYESFSAALASGLSDLLRHGEAAPPIVDPLSPASHFGTAPRPSIELLAYTFTIENPRNLFALPQSKHIRWEYSIGQFLWALAGSDDPEWLSYYHTGARHFAHDGISLCGAFGKRLFAYDGINQIKQVIERLRRDPGTRRAFASICTPSDNRTETREFPCSAGIQYFLRDGKLHSITYMRAQHALNLLPHDVFLFVALQFYVAWQLRASIGHYTHVCGTLHVYEDERALASAVSAETIPAADLGWFDGEEDAISNLWQYEAALRSAVLNGDQDAVTSFAYSKFPSGSFSEQAAAILLQFAYRKLGMTDLEGELVATAAEPLRAILQYCQ
ncbi:MAG: hypothetical protein JWP89_376 [Schlesneria sp.]|nr:hypothetical protein [Schlesneria sp.]